MLWDLQISFERFIVFLRSSYLLRTGVSFHPNQMSSFVHDVEHATGVCFRHVHTEKQLSFNKCELMPFWWQDCWSDSFEWRHFRVEALCAYFRGSPCLPKAIFPVSLLPPGWPQGLPFKTLAGSLFNELLRQFKTRFVQTSEARRVCSMVSHGSLIWQKFRLFYTNLR